MNTSQRLRESGLVILAQESETQPKSVTNATSAAQSLELDNVSYSLSQWLRKARVYKGLAEKKSLEKKEEEEVHSLLSLDKTKNFNEYLSSIMPEENYIKKALLLYNKCWEVLKYLVEAGTSTAEQELEEIYHQTSKGKNWREVTISRHIEQKKSISTLLSPEVKNEIETTVLFEYAECIEAYSGHLNAVPIWIEVLKRTPPSNPRFFRAFECLRKCVAEIDASQLVLVVDSVLQVPFIDECEDVIFEIVRRVTPNNEDQTLEVVHWLSERAQFMQMTHQERVHSALRLTIKDYLEVLANYQESEYLTVRTVAINSIQQLGDYTLKIINSEDESEYMKVQIFSEKLKQTSSYFERMFEHISLKENQNKEIIVRSESPEVFYAMIIFLYTKHIDLDESNVLDVLLCANQYGVQALKTKAEGFLSYRWTALAMSSNYTLAEIEDLYAIFESTNSPNLKRQVELLLYDQFFLRYLADGNTNECSEMVARYPAFAKLVKTKAVAEALRNAILNHETEEHAVFIVDTLCDSSRVESLHSVINIPDYDGDGQTCTMCGIVSGHLTTCAAYVRGGAVQVRPEFEINIVITAMERGFYITALKLIRGGYIVKSVAQKYPIIYALRANQKEIFNALMEQSPQFPAYVDKLPMLMEVLKTKEMYYLTAVEPYINMNPKIFIKDTVDHGTDFPKEVYGVQYSIDGLNFACALHYTEEEMREGMAIVAYLAQHPTAHFIKPERRIYGLDTIAPTMSAATAGNLPFIEYLIGKGVEPGAVIQANNWTALHFACVKKQPHIVEYFLSKWLDRGLTRDQCEHARYITTDPQIISIFERFDVQPKPSFTLPTPVMIPGPPIRRTTDYSNNNNNTSNNNSTASSSGSSTPSSDRRSISDAHTWKKKHFSSPTFCRVCDQFIWGVFRQGMACQICDVPCHKKCCALASTKGIACVPKSKPSRNQDFHL